jgi:conserved oligomeric Golgi complex subunit 8
MYFGASFSRYGFDFRPLFIRIFTETALSNFRQALDDANSSFQRSMQSYTFEHVTSSYMSESSNATNNAFIPPMILVNYMPLAVYCNALLTAFNDLRLCCPLAAVSTVKQSLTNSLCELRDQLVNYYQAEKLTLTAVESGHFLEFLRVVISIFVPYINTCLQTLFPDTQLARELALSVLEISEKSKLNRLDLDNLNEPLQQIIESIAPKKPQLVLQSTDTHDETDTSDLRS